MKRVKYFGFIIAMLFIFPMITKADTASVSITCSSSTVKAGDSFTCTLKGTSDVNVTDVDIRVSLGTGLTYGTFTPNADIWKQGDGDDARITLSAADATTGTFTIGTFTVNVNSSASDGPTSVGVNNVIFYKGKTKITGSDNSITLTISNAQEAEKKLRSLAASPGVLSPSFTPDGVGYALILSGDTSTFSLTATPQDSSHSVTFYNPDDGAAVDPTNISFHTASGKSEMMILICVEKTSCTESAHDYYVMVSKETPVDQHSYELSSLKVGDQTKALTSGLYEYTIELNDVSSYQVTADLVDRASYKITYQGLFDNENGIGRGEGQFVINIMPKDNSSGLESNHYTITVKKASGEVTPVTTQRPTTRQPTNPQTGSATSIIVALVLMASFGVSIYYYRKNASYFTK